MKKNIVIIFGYNNTRLYDIERLKRLCKNTLNAEILLCKEQILKHDTEISPYTLEINLEISDKKIIYKQIKEIDSYLIENQLNVIACLPFSDKGVPLGSYYAQSKGLNHDDCELSLACIDKYTFRCLEAIENTPAWYKKPFFTKIHSLEEAELIVIQTHVPLFFKPTSEGNSRGCIEIFTINDLILNEHFLEPYYEQGIIVEECIKNCDEYSFDGVDGNYVITEKKTSQGHFRVETQHILPAPLSREHYDRLIEAGKIVAQISGSNNGAVHNELFLNKKTGEVYCVEPNRRPAGLKLWDWVNLAYPGVDNWNSWINWAASRKKHHTYPIHNDYYVGCRMLQAPYSGTITDIDLIQKNLLENQQEVIEIVITKSKNMKITAKLKDNSDFIGYVVCKHKTIEGLHAALNTIAKKALSLLKIEKKELAREIQ
jgi:biotin carboxylase